MTMNFKTLALSSALGGLVLTAVGALLGGPMMALGVFVTGAVMMANLWAWSLVVGSAIRTTVEGSKPVWAIGGYGIKVGVLGLSVLALLSVFPVVSVILGSSVVVAAVSAWALRGLFGVAKVGDA